MKQCQFVVMVNYEPRFDHSLTQNLWTKYHTRTWSSNLLVAMSPAYLFALQLFYDLSDCLHLQYRYPTHWPHRRLMEPVLELANLVGCWYARQKPTPVWFWGLLHGDKALVGRASLLTGTFCGAVGVGEPCRSEDVSFEQRVLQWYGSSVRVKLVSLSVQQDCNLTVLLASDVG